MVEVQKQTLTTGPEECPPISQVAKALEENWSLKLTPVTLRRLEENRAHYEAETARRPVYGYCTGLGGLWQARGDCSHEWEENIIQEHARGTGESAPALLARSFMLSRIIQASRARAPLRPETLQRLVDAYNAGITPLIPQRGSLGASGDLVQSAHLAQCIYMGRGWAIAGTGTPPLPCSEALERAGMEPRYSLEPGEALALINNTAWTTGVALASLTRLWRIVDRLLRNHRLLSRITGCVGEEFSQEYLEEKKNIPHPLAREFSQTPCTTTSRLQDPYSIRCAPHTLAPLYTLVKALEETVSRELCSPGENPLIIGGKVYHGCHFHAGSVGVYCDALSIALVAALNMVERQASQLLDPNTTGLPAFLAGPESPVGEMITHYTLAAIVARARLLAAPASIHSIPTSGGQEDVVPQAAEAALKLWELTQLAEDALGLQERILKVAAERR